MPSREQDYNLIAVLHDQLEAIESYNKYLKDVKDCEDCARLWRTMISQAEAMVLQLREEIQRHAVD
jgi:hypothetical protein